MKVLVACEESQAVCNAFRALGHEAYSCDIIPCSGGHPEWHIQGDVLPLINGSCTFTTMDEHAHTQDGEWDMLIAFPPCTYLTNASAVRMRVRGEIQPERYLYQTPHRHRQSSVHQPGSHRQDRGTGIPTPHSDIYGG